MDATGPRILTDDLAYAAAKFRVPGGGKTQAAEGGRRSIVSDAKWSVGHLQRRQANVPDFANIEFVDAADEVDFLFQRELFEARVYAGFNRGSGGGWRLRGSRKPGNQK